MVHNYLWGEKGVKINALISSCAWNLKKMMINFNYILFSKK